MTILKLLSALSFVHARAVPREIPTMRSNVFLGSAALAIAFAFCWVSASAQTYPNRVIHLVAPFAPGGSNDIIARILGERLAEKIATRL